MPNKKRIILTVGCLFLLLFGAWAVDKSDANPKTKEGLVLVFRWPLVGKVSSGFGMRADPISPDITAHHNGLDIVAPAGTPVTSILAGRVTTAKAYGNYGNLVIIKHPSDRETYYGHLSSITVKEGHFVRPGQLIGTVGNSGRTSGYHLHFEIRDSGRPVDPMKYLSPHGNMTPAAAAKLYGK